MNKRLDRDLLEALIYVCIVIGEQTYHTPVGESITYKADSKIVPGKYTTDGRIREAIYFLQDEEAIQVIKEHVRPWKHSDQYVSWELDVIKDKLKDTEARLQKQYLGGTESLDTYRPEADNHNGREQIPKEIPTGWNLGEDDLKVHVQHYGKNVFTFSNNWSSKCKYFKCLWENYGIRVEYKKLYELNSALKYPNKGYTKINRDIRSIINKLREDPVFKKLPINIKTSKGFILTIND